MILFLGCSFTWGQGLYIDSWIESDMNSDIINSLEPPMHMAENLSYEDDNIRKKYHYPNLVAKNLNRPYATKFGNGGSNDDILHILKNIDKLMIIEGIELVVIQLTHVLRDTSFTDYYTENKQYDNHLNHYITSVLDKIEFICKDLGFDKSGNSIPIPYIVMSWHKDVADICEEILGNRFLTFGKYNNINDLMNSNDKFKISSKFKNIGDNHPSRECHSTISTYLIEKIKKLNIEFNTY